MITDAIVNSVLACLNAIFTVIPSLSIPSGASGALGFMYQMNGIFPVSAIFGVLALIVIWRVGLGTFDMVVFVYHQFWGSD